MNISRILFITIAALIGQQICATSFQIMNKSYHPLAYIFVKTTGQNYTFQDIPANWTSLIDLENNQLVSIQWGPDQTTAYVADFAQYKAKKNGQIPLRSDRKNFFNIHSGKKYSYRFDGVNVDEEQAEMIGDI